MTRNSRLTRTFSRPLTDLSNLLRSPSTTSSSRDKKNVQRQRSKTKHSKPPRIAPPARSLSTTTTRDTPRSTFREDFSPLFEPDRFNLDRNQVQEQEEHDGEEQFEYLIDSSERSRRSNGTKERSTLLEEEGFPELEEPSFFSAHDSINSPPKRASTRPRYGGGGGGGGGGGRVSHEEEEEEEEEVEDSFVTATEAFRGKMSSDSPVKSPSKFDSNLEEEEEEDEDEDGEAGESSPTSLASFDSSSRDRTGSLLDTPNTSFPSTPGADDEDFREERRGGNKEPWSSSTPSKLENLANSPSVVRHRNFTPPAPPRFVEVVETCPTPEHVGEQDERLEPGSRDSPLRNRRTGLGANQNHREEEARRRRSLFKTSELGHSYWDEESHEAIEGGEACRHRSTRAESKIKYTLPTDSHLDLHRSYAPSLVDTPRAARSRETTAESKTTISRPVSPRHDLFPSISATELVVASLLSSSALAASQPPTTTIPNSYSHHSQPFTNRLSSSSYRSNYFDPSFPSDLPANSSSTFPTPLYTRPLSYPHSSHRLPSRPSHAADAAAAAERSSPSSNNPLLPKSSTTTLFSYDLSHLPAPDTPLERPYRVGWRDVLKPSPYLGGGKGSGRFGDRFGAVERKVSSRRSRPPPPPAVVLPRELGTSQRSESGLWGIEEDGVGGGGRAEQQGRGKRRVDTPIPAMLGRSGSVRRSLSKWTIGRFGSTRDLRGVNEEEGDGETLATKKIGRSQSIRKSLSRSLSTFSVSGRRRRKEEDAEAERERLDQWVSVVVT